MKDGTDSVVASQKLVSGKTARFIHIKLLTEQCITTLSCDANKINYSKDSKIE